MELSIRLPVRDIVHDLYSYNHSVSVSLKFLGPLYKSTTIVLQG